MSKSAYIGALASLLLCAPVAVATARADWRSPIAGAPPILPSRFLPRVPHAAHRAVVAEPLGVSFDGAAPILPPRFLPLQSSQIRPSSAYASPPVHTAIVAPPPARLMATPRPADIAAPPLRVTPAAYENAPDPDAPPSDAPDAEAPIQFQWVAPLVDRRLSARERVADIAPELIEAIVRIEPMYDPTRLYGPAMPARMGVAAGSAAMDNVFADHWQRADLDANVNQRVPYIAMAWHRRGALPCEGFSKMRARGYNQPALTALSRADCAALARTQARGDRVTLVPVVAATLGLPAFAAPMPGARLSSVAFWAQRRAEIAQAEEDLRLRHVWHGGKEGVGKDGFGKSFARR